MALPTPDPPLLNGRYRLIRLLGAGATGTVWRAEHVPLNSPVAVKFFGSAPATTWLERERFLREARAAASLQSPHLVKIFDYGVREGTPFIVTELLAGETLAARLQRDGRLRRLEEVALIFRQIARALGRAHEAGISHGDLKPANIFLVRNGEEELVKVLDLGMAKRTAPRTGASPVSQARNGEFLGSPAYSSPEQLEGSTAIDSRTDIWSLGVIAFECLLGSSPFRGPTLAAVVLAVRSKPLPVPSGLGAVPAGFDAWFARACAREVGSRFQSVREAARELRRLLEAVLDARLLISPAEGGTLTGGILALRPPRPRSRAPLFTLGALLLAVLVSLAARSRRPLAEAGAPQISVQALAPVKRDELTAAEPVAPIAATGLRVFGDSTGLRLALDGVERGPLPAELSDLAPGEHTLQVTGGARYEALEQRVLIEPEHMLSIGPVQLRVIKGLAILRAGPSVRGAELSLQVGDSRRSLPALPLRLDVETGLGPILVAERKGYTRFEEPLVFEPGQAEKTFEINLTKLPAGAVDRSAGNTRVSAPARRSRDHERNAAVVEPRSGDPDAVPVEFEAQRGGGLEPIAVQQTVDRYGAAVRDDCWERILGARTAREQKVARLRATLVIEPSGRVGSVVTTGATEYPDLARCVEGKLYGWTFPEAAAETTVHLPFAFFSD